MLLLCLYDLLLFVHLGYPSFVPKEPILNLVDNNIPIANDVIRKILLQPIYNDELKKLESINSNKGVYNSSTNITKDSLQCTPCI